MTTKTALGNITIEEAADARDEEKQSKRNQKENILAKTDNNLFCNVFTNNIQHLQHKHQKNN
jgi:hypothetical protein